MIFRREEYVQEDESNDRFPVRHIDAMVPLDGSAPRFIGSVTLGLQTAFGVQQLPLSFEIEAKTIEEAFRKFDEVAEPRIEEARRGLEEEFSRLRREASSRIVTPGEVGMTGLGGELPGMGGPGGGKIVDFRRLKP